MTYDEMAAVLGISAARCQQLVAKAQRKFAERWAYYYDAPPSFEVDASPLLPVTMAWRMGPATSLRAASADEGLHDGGGREKSWL